MSKTRTPDPKVLSLEPAAVAPGIIFETVSEPLKLQAIVYMYLMLDYKFYSRKSNAGHNADPTCTSIRSWLYATLNLTLADHRPIAKTQKLSADGKNITR